VILEPPLGFFVGQPQVQIGVSGASANWGGCDVWFSIDGINYENIGRITQASAMGVTTSPLPVGADPDTAHLLTLDLSESFGALASASHTTADNYTSSLWICNADYSNGELIGYGIETLTGAHQYKLSDSGGGAIYLRRGQLGTPI